jgi:DNA-binding transcriptional regulator YiaG
LRPAQFKKIREKHGLTQSVFAQILGVRTDRVIRGYESGTHKIPGSVAILAKIIDKNGGVLPKNSS